MCTTAHKKKLGQYFTISEELQNFIYDKVKYKSSLLLEPSFGAGHLLQKFKAFDENYPMMCYEIDDTIPPVISFTSQQTVFYGDFTKQRLTQKFKTIIGNPPFVKQHTGNLYLTFIELCFQSLDEKGELLFIVPSDFIKQTRASALLTTMTQQGSFTDFLFPNNEKLFDSASIDIVVFRYEKDLYTKKTNVNGEEMFCNIHNGILTFSKSEISGRRISDLFHVYVGLVSGRDAIYRVPFGNIDIRNDKERVERFIFATKFPTENTHINEYLLEHKPELLSRKIRAFSETNWFEWGAPRNITNMQKHWGAPCIYVRNMTRKPDVAFTGTVQYFGGTLLCLVPKCTMLAEDIQKIVQFMNTPAFQKDYMYAGRFKIGHKQISNAVIPD
jgi:adenine-specific DNA-methyltransferase